jgi:hypothetical protein
MIGNLGGTGSTGKNHKVGELTKPRLRSKWIFFWKNWGCSISISTGKSVNRRLGFHCYPYRVGSWLFQGVVGSIWGFCRVSSWFVLGFILG